MYIKLLLPPQNLALQLSLFGADNFFLLVEIGQAHIVIEVEWLTNWSRSLFALNRVRSLNPQYLVLFKEIMQIDRDHFLRICHNLSKVKLNAVVPVRRNSNIRKETTFFQKLVSPHIPCIPVVAGYLGM
jgi:hypothetical protein